jgi:hypothetical protein
MILLKLVHVCITDAFRWLCACEDLSLYYSFPYTGPWDCSRLRLPGLVDSRHMQVARLSALCTGCLYPPRRHLWYSFMLEAESTPGP